MIISIIIVYGGETHSNQKVLRDQWMLEYSLKYTHALTCAHSRVDVKNHHSCRQHVDLAMCQDWNR